MVALAVLLIPTLAGLALYFMLRFITADDERKRLRVTRLENETRYNLLQKNRDYWRNQYGNLQNRYDALVEKVGIDGRQTDDGNGS